MNMSTSTSTSNEISITVTSKNYFQYLSKRKQLKIDKLSITSTLLNLQ